LLQNALVKNNFEPIIASDGDALQVLKHEFPKLTSIEIASYNIKYSTKGKDLKRKLITQIPKTLKAIKAEKKQTKTIVEDYNIDGIISDNRFGVFSKKVPSVFITHQLNVLSGNTSAISSKLNTLLAKKFNEIWVPDFEKEPNLSGKELNTYKENILFVRGKIEAKQTITKKEQFTIYNFMLGKPLEDAINKSEIILSRSGYTTIMDLAKLEKKAFFIPTPGQFEQEYLAKQLDNLGLVPTCNQEEFSVERLNKVDNYNGLNMLENTIDYKALFSLF